MMRPEGEVPSDFQEYTLVALFALAAHLTGGVAAQQASLPAMARHYQQDSEIIQQVQPCCIVLHCRQGTAFCQKPAVAFRPSIVRVPVQGRAGIFNFP